MKGWFNSIYSNYKYNNKRIYYRVCNKSKEVFWVLIPLLMKEITIYSSCITKVLILYTSISV